jgi:hypothetical protein
MTDPSSRAERYRKEANRYAELAKDAQPAYRGDVYRKLPCGMFSWRRNY